VVVQRPLAGPQCCKPGEGAGYTPTVKLSRIIINGVALIAAALIVPGVHLAWKTDPTQTLVALVVLAVVFGIINAYIRPVLRAVSLPINLVSMGLFGFFLNAGLLLLLAWLVDKLGQPVLHIGTFPPNLSTETLTAAVAGSLVITVVSTLLSVLLPDA
jgi:putative membrane protein